MKRNILLLAGLLLACLCGHAQHDTKARDLLDRMAEAYRQAGAVSIRFAGTQSGTLEVKGDKFHLKSGGVETWFDGKTQWSYVEQNGEVNVSTPTPEELRGVNPYALVNSYLRRIPAAIHLHHPAERRETGVFRAILPHTPESGRRGFPLQQVRLSRRGDHRLAVSPRNTPPRQSKSEGRRMELWAR